MDRPFYAWCVRLSQLMMLNVLVLATSWPILTLPVSLLAACGVLRRMADPEKDPTWRELVKTYLAGMVEDPGSSLTVTASGLLVAVNLWIVAAHEHFALLGVGFLVPAILLVDWQLTTTLLAAHFRMAPWVLLRSGFIVMLRNLGRGVPAIALGIVTWWMEWQAPFALAVLGPTLPLGMFVLAHRTPMAWLADHMEQPAPAVEGVI